MDRRDQLVKDYHRFLCQMAGRLMRTNGNAHRGGTFDDWYQEAALALLEADKRFDPNHGAKFITYATVWVWGRIRQAARVRNNLIRVAISATSDTSKYHDKADAAFAIRPLQDKDGELSCYCDVPAPEPPEPVMGEDQVERLLRVLDPRSAELIRKRYGFDGPPRTLQELSDEMGVTKERVRQIEGKALKRMERVPLTL